MSYVSKDKADILRQALQTLQTTTPITSIGPGSVARSLAEVFASEIGDLSSIVDFNTSMTVISTARGRALDLMGELYNVNRKQLGTVATIDQSVGAFYFYLSSPHVSDITIPKGTVVYTNDTDYVGQSFTYETTDAVTIPAGRLRVYAALKPKLNDSIFTVGANTLTKHSYTASPVTVLCTNPKAISPQVGLESDDNYRARIVKEVRRSAGGTDDAIRFTALQVAGVRDAVVRPTPYGLATTEALVVPEERSFVNQVMADVNTALAKVRPSGVRLFVREPDYLSCEIHATIVLRSGLAVDPSGTARRAEIGILRYLNTLLPGTPLVYTQLIQSVLDASDAIADVALTRYRFNGAEALRRNYEPNADQQIVPGDITVLPAT